MVYKNFGLTKLLVRTHWGPKSFGLKEKFVKEIMHKNHISEKYRVQIDAKAPKDVVPNFDKKKNNSVQKKLE